MSNYRIMSVLIGLAVMLLAACGTSTQEHNQRVIQEANLPNGAVAAVNELVALSRELNQTSVRVAEISRLQNLDVLHQLGQQKIDQYSAIHEEYEPDEITDAMVNSIDVWCIRYIVKGSDLERFVMTTDGETYIWAIIHAGGRDGDAMWDYLGC